MSSFNEKKITRFITWPLAVIVGLCACGCNDKFFDPTQIGRFRPVPAVNVILESLGVADEKTSEWSGAEDPRPIDIMIFEENYTFSAGDVIRISIFELLQQEVTFLDNYVVTESGRISIPEVGIVEAEGLTEEQLEEEIRQILSPSILKDPLVTVISLSSERRQYSILGNGAGNAGRFPIPRYDFRLNDALAIAGVATQFNISYVYINRDVTGKEFRYDRPAEQSDSEGVPDISEDEMLDLIAPSAQVQRPASQLVVTAAEFDTDLELIDVVSPEQTDTAGRVEWIFKDGKWVPVSTGQPQGAGRIPAEEFDEPTSAQKSRAQQIPDEFDWEQVGTGGVQSRVIKIPTDKLAGGDPRYNIVIRPRDTIHVPLDIIGEFAIMGNVNAQGYINLTGRPMTLKMAIAAAGGLGPLAWPKNVEVTRRIGKNKEETVLVNLEKISAGEEPDFFIKPNDLVNVGTHVSARWRAVLRNSFRATYGFGFTYDRNFADRDVGTSRPLPNWF